MVIAKDTTLEAGKRSREEREEEATRMGDKDDGTMLDDQHESVSMAEDDDRVSAEGEQPEEATRLIVEKVLHRVAVARVSPSHSCCCACACGCMDTRDER